MALPNIFFWLVVPVGLVSWCIYHWFYQDIITTSFLWLFEAYLFMLFFILLYKVLDWYADVWIITDHGMVDVRWSIFINDMTFTEFDDISSVQYGQRSLFDKLFDIGDVTIHKMGDEMYISRMHHPSKIADIIQSNIHTHHHEEHKAASDTHIYLDGVRQNHTSVPYKSGFRYMPAADDEKFVEEMRKQPGVIDLSGKPKIEEKKHGHASHGQH